MCWYILNWNEKKGEVGEMECSMAPRFMGKCVIFVFICVQSAFSENQNVGQQSSVNVFL